MRLTKNDYILYLLTALVAGLIIGALFLSIVADYEYNDNNDAEDIWPPYIFNYNITGP